MMRIRFWQKPNPVDDLRAELFGIGVSRGFGWVRAELLADGRYDRLSAIPDAEVRAIHARVVAAITEAA